MTSIDQHKTRNNGLNKQKNGDSMNFYNYMMKNYYGKTCPEGDLASDMHEDKASFPMNGKGKFNGWHKLIRSYLDECGACDACIDVFEKCWKEYEACERLKLKRD